MNLDSERMQAYWDNSASLGGLRRVLKEVVRPLDTLRTLDYGVDASSSLSSHFSGLHPNETVYTFDPRVDPIGEFLRSFLNRLGKDLGFTNWVNRLPGYQFDLVVCHFSIHNMQKSPREAIESLRAYYNPKLVAIAEYDYTGATKEEFERTFVADAEKEELWTRFKGDPATCFDFHSRFGEKDYYQALIDQGFRVSNKGVGQGYAANKIFLIGEATNSQL